MRRRSAPAIHPARVGIPRVRRRRLRRTVRAVGSRRIDPRHRQLADVVDLDRPRVRTSARTTSSPSRTRIWSAIEPVGISRTPVTFSCCGSIAASCLPLTMSASGAPSRASSRAATTWSIHGTGASDRPISSATSVRSTSVAPSPPADSGNAIVVAPIAHSRSHRLLSNPDSCAARTVSIGQCVLKNCLYASWIAR